MLKIIPIPVLKDNYIWCIIHPESMQCIIIDAGEASPVIQFIRKNNLKLQAIAVTHHHWDHIQGIAELIQYNNVPVYGPYGENIPLCNYPLKEMDLIEIDSMELKLKTLSIPGHTKSHIALYGENFLFTGDTLFTAGCGKVFEGTYEQMWNSLQKLAKLPNSTDIYCGHEYTENNLRFAALVEPSNVAIQKRIQQTKTLRAKNLPTVPALLSLEKETNPFLRVHISDVHEAAEKYIQKKLNSPVEVFQALREWKNNL